MDGNDFFLRMRIKLCKTFSIYNRVFNSLVKSVGEYLCPKTTPAVTSSFLLNCLTKTIDTITLSLNIGNIDDEIYISG